MLPIPFLSWDILFGAYKYALVAWPLSPLEPELWSELPATYDTVSSGFMLESCATV
jgi:hypothetical protein